jgi:hypothetical protein
VGPEWIAAAAGIVGALGAVLIQGLLAHFGGETERKRELLLEAYQALIESIASLSIDRPAAAATRDLIAAKQRILQFAPVEVVHALADFCRTSQVLANADAVEGFVRLLKAMRHSLGMPEVTDADMLRILVSADTLAGYPQAGT